MLKIIGIFDNLNVKNNGVATIRFKFPYSEIGNYSRLLLHIDTEIKCKVVTGDDTVIKVGNVLFKALRIDKDGEATFSIDGGSESVELSKLSRMLDTEVIVYIKSVKDENKEEE